MLFNEFDFRMSQTPKWLDIVIIIGGVALIGFFYSLFLIKFIS